MTGADVRVTVRFYAAARAAAGVESEVIDLTPGSTIADAMEQLRCRNAELERVLRRCSYLCDGVAVRDVGTELRGHQSVDVLPPFAGG